MYTLHNLDVLVASLEQSTSLSFRDFVLGSHRYHRVPGPTLQRVRSICLSTIALLLPSKIAWDLSSTDNFFEFFGNLAVVFKYRVGFFGEEIERK